MEIKQVQNSATQIALNDGEILPQESYNLVPIGQYFSKAQKPYEAPRQGVLEQNSLGLIRLNPKQNFEQALSDLIGFERIWLIYIFHRNTQFWNTMVSPPRSADFKKKGLFATRSPHRPNPIGMSCVKLKEIRGLKIWVEESDLLDKTPILDIKPYIPYADSFPSAKAGWLEGIEKTKFTLYWSEIVLNQLSWVQKHTRFFLKSLVEQHLEYLPLDHRHKRIDLITGQKTVFFLGIRTWRILFEIFENAQEIKVMAVYTGYSPSEISLDDDPHGDKKIHRAFLELNPNSFSVNLSQSSLI